MSKIFEKKFPNGIYQIFSEKPELSNLVEIHQVHGNIISNDDRYVEADGIYLHKVDLLKNIPAVKTADCLPIIYSGKNSAALIHAGWRGLQQGIHIHNDLKQEKFDHIYIGPSITSKNFEVTEEFRAYFPNSECFSTQNSELTFNLQQYALIQLRECFPLAIIETSEICTFDDLNFSSYRRNSTTNRNWNIFKYKD